MDSIALMELLNTRLQNFEPKFTRFDSGSFILDLVIDKVPYCVEYFSSEQVFGLSKRQQDSPFFEGIDESFLNVDLLIARIDEVFAAGR